MILEVIYNLVHFNAGFFINIIANNLFWVFAFICLGHFFGEGKKLFENFIMPVGMIYCFFDLAASHGLLAYTATYLGILYITRMAVLMFLENSKTLKKHLLLGFFIATYTVLLVYNFFMV